MSMSSVFENFFESIPEFDVVSWCRNETGLTEQYTLAAVIYWGDSMTKWIGTNQ